MAGTHDVPTHSTYCHRVLRSTHSIQNYFTSRRWHWRLKVVDTLCICLCPSNQKKRKPFHFSRFVVRCFLHRKAVVWGVSVTFLLLLEMCPCCFIDIDTLTTWHLHFSTFHIYSLPSRIILFAVNKLIKSVCMTLYQINFPRNPNWEGGTELCKHSNTFSLH